MHVVGVADIAAAAGASKLSLYRNVGSKLQLVAAMLVDRSERIHAWLRHGTEDAAPGRPRVLAVLDLLTAWFGEAQYRGCLVVNTAVDTRAGDDEVRRLTRTHLQGYRDLLVERLGELDPAPVDAEAPARQLLLLIDGAITVAALDDTEGHAGPAGADARRAASTLISSATRREDDRHGVRPGGAR